MAEDKVLEEALERAIFEQQDDEETAWYDRFFKFYVKLGQGRTLRAAYLLHNETLAEQAVHAPSYEKWREHARELHWKKRAVAYDYEMNIYAAQQVEEARGRLQQATVIAAEALILSLKNSRTRVSGAKAILDRGGLPPVKELRHSVEPFHADELAQAAEELDAWDSQMNGSNGSSVPEV